MVDAEVIAAIPEHITTNGAPNIFTASNGIVLKLRPVAPMIILDAQRRLVEPTPPMIANFEKGEGSDAPLEENPNDPIYQRELQAYRQKVGEVSNAIFLTQGVSVESVPDGINKPEDDEWSDDLTDIAGLEIPKVGKRRLYCWIKYVALTSMDDFQALLNKLTVLGGVTLEQDVTNAETSFRPDEGGSAVTRIPPDEEV